MSRNRQIISCILCLAMAWPLFAVANASAPVATKLEAKGALPVKPAAPAAVSEKQELLDLIAEDNVASDVVIDAAWGEHNPFNGEVLHGLPAPLEKQPSIAPGDKKLALSGILWSGNRPSAVINDRVYGVGSTVAGMTIKEIGENRVVLSDGNNQQILSLHQ